MSVRSTGGLRERPRLLAHGPRAATLALIVSLAPVHPGCTVEPYCLYCGDGSSGDGSWDGDAQHDGPPADAAADADTGDTTPDALGDADADGCLAEELCNGLDDDCDGEIDEDIALEVDPLNCGECGRRCRYDHARGLCVGGACEMGRCASGWNDLNGDAEDGCEYPCTPTAEDDSRCDRRDNDCDGHTDEDVAFADDPENCGACGRVCRYAHGDGACDGGECVLASCEAGYTNADDDALNGCEYPCVPADPAIESCNRRDDDCDGVVDEGNPGGGAACGSEVGACVEGTTTCTAGVLVCADEVPPTAEVCNGVDDDCDGSVDDAVAGTGALCGTALGTCVQGRIACVAGALVCDGEVGPVAEACDGLDNDCDGLVDDGNPDGGAACGSGIGACGAGLLTCASGVLVCVGAADPSAELCDEIDNDCDGETDEDFDLDTDRFHCGECDNVCDLDFAVATCDAGECEVVSCLAGHYDDDGDPTNGCEYACSFNGADVCNGVDDDCDGTVDEGVTPPPFFCNANGVCAGTSATCAGGGGWTCAYPATYEATETLCDGLDNDCDGAVDEDYPLKGTACTRGAGACQTSGTVVCGADGISLECDADEPGDPHDEACDDLDNDCDGLVDEVEADAPGTAWRDGVDVTALDVVEVARPGGGTMLVMQYEASRPDATDVDQGSATTLACSRAGVLPWTLVTWDEASTACCALNAGGGCPGASETGWRLCSADEWERACVGPSSACTWAYASDCTTSQDVACNGVEYDCDPGAAGNQDCLATTGSSTFPECASDWGAAGLVYDLSGNVKEWTSTEVSADAYQIRGGSYQSIEAGRACDFDFAVAEAGFAHANTGFRCCYY